MSGYRSMSCLLALLACTIAVVGVHATSCRKSIGGRTGAMKSAHITPDMTWHNGWVMGDADIVIVWYGGWTTTGGVNTPSTISTMMKYLDQSSWYNVNRYYGAKGAIKLNTTQKVKLHSSFAIPNPSQKVIKEGDVPNILKSLIVQKKLPWLPNTGVYVLMVGNGITYNEMCTLYCGWHDVFGYLVGSTSYQVPFAAVGNVAKCFPICSIYNTAADRSAPNHPEIDGTASIFAHEVVEAISNPGTGGWFDSNGEENADKCAWKFGTGVKKGVRKDLSTYNYNSMVGGQPFMLQMNWDPRKGTDGKQKGCTAAA